MKVSRRGLLKNAFIAAAAAGTGWSAAGRATASPATAPIRSDLRIYDSRLPSSRDWLGERSELAIDVAEEHASRWNRLRSLTPGGPVAGLTTWSDYVQVRGLLQEKGCRLRVEARVGRLFYWEMA